MSTARALFVTIFGLAGVTTPVATVQGAEVRELPTPIAAQSLAVASPDTRRFAWLAADSQLVVSNRGRRTRTYAIPSGCLPGAITHDVVILNCVAPRTMSLRLASGVVSPVLVGRLSSTASNYETFTASAVGRHWIAGAMSVMSEIGSRDSYPVLVSRTTGAVVDIDGVWVRTARRWGARRYIDLSSSSPARRLCRPVRRAPSPYAVSGRFSALIKVGSWTLRDEPRSVPSLQRCGTTRRLRTGANAALGYGYSAWISQHRVVLRNLATGEVSRYRYRGPRPTLQFSRDLLVASSPRGVIVLTPPG